MLIMNGTASISGALSRLLYPRRVIAPEVVDIDDHVDAWAEAAAMDYGSRLEDTFVERALGLGVEGGVLLDVGTQLGLVVLKILWRNENLYGIGVDGSGPMVERARATAEAWGLSDRMFFQVGHAHGMRFKSGYFDLVISSSALHRFENPIGVLAEIRRVTKPTGAILLQDLRRPTRFRMARHLAEHSRHYPSRIRPLYESLVRAAYTRREIKQFTAAAGIEHARIFDEGRTHIGIERRGSTDAGSWVMERERYR